MSLWWQINPSEQKDSLAYDVADQHIKDCVFKRFVRKSMEQHVTTSNDLTYWHGYNYDMCAWPFPAPNGPPTNLVVFNETITSMNARWNPAPGRVQNYKITYVPTAGGRTQTVSHTKHQYRRMCLQSTFTSHASLCWLISIKVSQREHAGTMMKKDQFLCAHLKSHRKRRGLQAGHHKSWSNIHCTQVLSSSCQCTDDKVWDIFSPAELQRGKLNFTV